MVTVQSHEYQQTYFLQMAIANDQDIPINPPTISEVEAYQENLELQVNLVHEKVGINSQQVHVYIDSTIGYKTYLEMIQGLINSNMILQTEICLGTCKAKTYCVNSQSRLNVPSAGQSTLTTTSFSLTIFLKLN